MQEEWKPVGVTEEILPLRLPRPGERVVAERRRWVRTGGPFFDWMLQTLCIHDRAVDEPHAHDYLARRADHSDRVWVLKALYAQRIDPLRVSIRIGLTDECDIDPDEWAALDVAPESVDEPDPVWAALDRAEEAQQLLQRAEAVRVTRAVHAWRAAQAAEGEPTASNTPYQRGFFTDLGFKLRMHATTAKVLVHSAADLEAALPQTWAHFTSGMTSWKVMQTVHAHLDGLDPVLHAAFDAGVLRKLFEVTPTGLPDALRRLRERLQATTADERHETAAARRHVRVEPVADGMAWLHAYLPAADALALDHQLTKAAVEAAGREGETRGIGPLRADVLIDGLHAFLRASGPDEGVLVKDRAAVEPRVFVTIPAMTALGHSGVPATLEGYGTIGITTALRLAGEAKSWVRVLTDPLTGTPMTLGRTRYRPTRDMRLMLRLLDGGGRGPGSVRAPGDTEVDHAVSFNKDGAGGTTAIGNLALLSRADHKGKTDGAGDYDLLLDRTLLWDTPTGTTIVTRPVQPLEPTPVPEDLIDSDDCPF